jgi:hypothetical protein
MLKSTSVGQKKPSVGSFLHIFCTYKGLTILEVTVGQKWPAGPALVTPDLG